LKEEREEAEEEGSWRIRRRGAGLGNVLLQL